MTESAAFSSATPPPGTTPSSRAARAALEEGQVPGGGVALINAADAVRETVLGELEGDERTGAQIILKSL